MRQTPAGLPAMYAEISIAKVCTHPFYVKCRCPEIILSAEAAWPAAYACHLQALEPAVPLPLIAL
jgi:hypothetical protein